MSGMIMPIMLVLLAAQNSRQLAGLVAQRVYRVQHTLAQQLAHWRSFQTCETVPRDTPALAAGLCFMLDISRSPRYQTLLASRCYQKLFTHQSDLSLSVGVTAILHASESKRAGAIFAGRHQQKLPVLIQSVRLRKIPQRPLRLIVAAAAQQSRRECDRH